MADRLEELFAANRKPWLTGMLTWAVPGADWTRSHRGFIGRFRGGPKQFLGDLWATVRRLCPVEAV